MGNRAELCHSRDTAAAWVLLRDNSFAPRLGVLAAAGVSGGGAVLVGTVGLPGRVPSGFGATEAGIVALAVAVAILVVMDVRKCPRTRVTAPYAL